MKQANRIKSLITILTVLALLLTLMPMSVMAKGNDKKNPAAQASEKAVREQKNAGVKPVKNNPKAQFIAERNEWAKANGLPPGYANIIYKYLVTSDQLAVVTKDAASVTIAMDGLKAYFTAFTPLSKPEYFNLDGSMNIKVFMSAIKQLKIVAEAEDLELPEEEEEVEDEDEGAEEAPAPAPAPVPAS